MDFKERFNTVKEVVEDDVLPHLKKGKDIADKGCDIAESFVVQSICRRPEKDIDSMLDRLADDMWAKFKRWRNQ